MTHGLIVVPVLLPLVAGALMLLLRDSRREVRALLNIVSTAIGLGVATMLLWNAGSGSESDAIGVYLAGNWRAPFGITLVVDRLSALMLVLTAVVGLGAALYAEAGWSRAGAHFHALFQFQLMGLNGAFLTGDLFNLFVFFEVMLAASYGLQLHGSGWNRVRAGMHYLVMNLLASALFLIGLAVIYGIMGTLSMADIADKAALVAPNDRALLHVGAAILAVAFLVKAAIWPLNAWLVPAYTSASTPVAALFVLMTKVGIYAVLRVWMLLFSAQAGASAHFGGPALLAGGLVTLAIGAAGVLGAIRLDRIAACSVIVSAGTLLAAFGFDTIEASAAALFYLVSATLAASGLFLLVELVKRTSVEGRAQLPDVAGTGDEDANLDDEEVPLVGRPFPVSVVGLGIAFITIVLLVAGLPPLSGFLAKVALLDAVIGPGGGTASPAAPALVALLLAAGLCTTISLTRAGIRHFWAKGGSVAPHVKPTEAAAVVVLLAASVSVSVLAEPVMQYAAATARNLHHPQAYIDAVLGTQPRPGPASAAAGTASE